MTSELERKDIAHQRKGLMSSDYASRAALAITRLVPGPHQDKAIARIFGVSVRMAQYLKGGCFWTIDRLNQASQCIPGFDAYLASPDFHTCRLDEIARELDEIRLAIKGKGNEG